MVLGAASLFGLPAQAQMADHPADQPLTVAAEVGFAPWIMKTPDGKLQGFQVDVTEELAKRMGRPGFRVIDTVWANIFAGLYAKQYEFVIGPTTITAKRAEELLFAEPYLDVSLGFLTGRKLGAKKIEELKGRRIGVTSGSVQDDWMNQNAAKYGITVQRFDATTDALQAILSGRSDGYMTMESTGLWTIKQQPGRFAFDVAVPTGQHMGLPFRPADVDFRNLVERHIECMKQDGTLAKIYQKWFNRPPGPKSSTVTVYPGYGAVGWKGYASEPHQVNCASKSG
jgi:polar amino acid transport system substrate-binding protein